MKGIELRDELIFLKNRNAVQKTSDASMAGKTCVITGATSGIGLQAMKRLARGGADIVMVCRNLEKAKAARHDTMSTHRGVSVRDRSDYPVVPSGRTLRTLAGGCARYHSFHSPCPLLFPPSFGL